MKSVNPHLIITVAVALFFIPIPFFQSVLFDDPLLVNAIEEGDFEALYYYFDHKGFPLTAYFHWWIGKIPNYQLAVKIISFACLLILANLYYLILCTHQIFSSKTAILTAIMASVLPIYPFWPFQITLIGKIAMLMLYLGMYCHSRYMYGNNKSLLWLSILLILLSFHVVTLIPVFYGYILGVYILKYFRSIEGADKKPRIDHTIWLWLVSPVFLFAVQRYLNPSTGYAAKLQVIDIFLNSTKSVVLTFLDHLILVYKLVLTEPMLLFTTCVFVCCLTLIVWKLTKQTMKTSNSESWPKSAYLWVAMFGLCWSLLTISPYVLVGKYSRGYNYHARHNRHIGLPIAILLMGGLVYIQKKKSFSQNAGLGLVGLFATLNLTILILWQNRQTKMDGIEQSLKELGTVNSTYVLFRDKSDIGIWVRTLNYEWNWLMKKAWNSENHVGISIYPYKYLYGADELYYLENHTPMDLILGDNSFIGDYKKFKLLDSDGFLREYLKATKHDKADLEVFRRFRIMKNAQLSDTSNYSIVQVTNKGLYNELEVFLRSKMLSGDAYTSFVKELIDLTYISKPH